MNLGQAVAVCLYELARETKAPRGAEKVQAAAAGEVERLTGLLLESLAASGYLKPRSGAATWEKVRRLVRRLQLPASDAEVWLGMLRKITWNLRHGD